MTIMMMRMIARASSSKVTLLSRIRTNSSASVRTMSTSSSSSSSAGKAFDDKNTYTHFSQQREPVVPHSLSNTKPVPSHIVRPPYGVTGIIPPNFHPEHIKLHDEASIGKMRHAARLARHVLDFACSLAKPGVTTDAIDTAVHEAIIREGAYPSPLNYAGFPKSLCSSINEVICHGIPDSRPLQHGDIVSFDVSCFVNGVHGDNCATVVVGDEQDIDEIGIDWQGVPYKAKYDSEEEEAMLRAARRLVHATRESLYAAIDRCRPGGCLTEVGAAIQDVADDYGYSTVEKYRGHGIGEEFHCAPFVKHYRNSDVLELVPGMIFTIEPMLVECAGACFEWSDQWTVATVDGGMAAQFEHTILITETGTEILTLPEYELTKSD